MTGEPGIGYVLCWVDAGQWHSSWHTGDGFSMRAKEEVARLIARGIAPVCYATVQAFKLVDDDEHPYTEILADDWMPVLNHMLVRQQRGEMLQKKPRGKPQRTFAQLREELDAAQSGSDDGV